jgi:hypothetical protein
MRRWFICEDSNKVIENKSIGIDAGDARRSAAARNPYTAAAIDSPTPPPDFHPGPIRSE